MMTKPSFVKTLLLSLLFVKDLLQESMKNTGKMSGTCIVMLSASVCENHKEAKLSFMCCTPFDLPLGGLMKVKNISTPKAVGGFDEENMGFLFSVFVF